MIIPWRGIMSLPLAKIISKGPIIYFPFLSIHDVLVLERKKIKSNSIKAKLVFFTDKIACKLADIIIIDSESHKNHFLNKFNLRKEKFRVLFFGTNEDEFFQLPVKKNTEKFSVLYFGSFVPPHGIDFILKCAYYLRENQDIRFKLCGDGYLKKDMENLAKKMKLMSSSTIKLSLYNRFTIFIRHSFKLLGGNTNIKFTVIRRKSRNVKKFMAQPFSPSFKKALKTTEVWPSHNAIIIDNGKAYIFLSPLYLKKLKTKVLSNN